MKPKTAIWKYFSTDKDKKRVLCKFCKSDFFKNTTRMRNHILEVCQACPGVIKDQFKTNGNNSQRREFISSASKEESESRPYKYNAESTSQQITSFFIDKMSINPL